MSMTASFNAFRLQLLFVLACLTLVTGFVQITMTSILKYLKGQKVKEFRNRVVYLIPFEQELSTSYLKYSYTITPQFHSA